MIVVEVMDIYPLDYISLGFQYVDFGVQSIFIWGLLRPNMSIMFGSRRIQYLSRKWSGPRHVHNRNAHAHMLKTTLLISLICSSIDFNWCLWIRRNIKRIEDEIKWKSNARTQFYWDDKAARRCWTVSDAFVLPQNAKRVSHLKASAQLFLGSANWISDWGLWIQGINFTATMHQLFPVRDTEAVLFSKLIIRRVY